MMTPAKRTRFLDFSRSAIASTSGVRTTRIARRRRQGRAFRPWASACSAPSIVLRKGQRRAALHSPQDDHVQDAEERKKAVTTVPLRQTDIKARWSQGRSPVVVSLPTRLCEFVPQDPTSSSPGQGYEHQHVGLHHRARPPREQPHDGASRRRLGITYPRSPDAGPRPLRSGRRTAQGRQEALSRADDPVVATNGSSAARIITKAY